MSFVRSGKRAADQLRPVRITRGYTIHAEGSVLIEFGNTRVLCTASVEDKVPPHKRGSMPYSAVTQPSPLPRLCGGTFSSTDAVHSTSVSPNSISTEPSAWMVNPRVMRTGRSWSAARPLVL